MGACHEHWNKLIPELNGQYTVYAMDLLGFGDSDKPLASKLVGPRGHFYNYDTWSLQIRDFVNEVVRAPAVVVGNSAGALSALQAAVNAPHLLRGLVLLDCTMRNMHKRNQPAFLHPAISALQFVLRDTPIGQWAVDAVLRTPGMLKAVLKSAYGDRSCLSPQLVASFTQHLTEQGSRDVLLDVFTNSNGPLPQDLLPLNVVPTIVVWGAADPWEPLRLAEKIFKGYTADFVVLPGVGHFPQDEVPNLIGAILDAFVEECAVEAAEDEAAAAARPGSCRASVDGEERVEGFTLRGLMAAAEMDSKV
ncbi:Alpha/Beta hydrolase protein [Scenedesmus sp. NREL 46B-D3]|nr:Alpha/Beta hydrolase protein [Scenedesmus sp. NREL 46B-D3]